MTAPAPDPRFRDQLAEALWCRDVGSNDAPPLSEQGEGTQRVYRSDADGMLLRLAPVVEAQVQAAAKQRAAEVAAEVRALARRYGGRDVPVSTVKVARRLRTLAAALTPGPVA